MVTGTNGRNTVHHTSVPVCVKLQQVQNLEWTTAIYKINDEVNSGRLNAFMLAICIGSIEEPRTPDSFMRFLFSTLRKLQDCSGTK